MWIKNQKRKPQHQQRRNNSPETVVVGTEAIAKANLERNARDFAYPNAGFVHKIEYTLLYSMLQSPLIYPYDTIVKSIQEEDFEPYLLIQSTNANDPEYRSLAQLSALLALASEKFVASSSTINSTSDSFDPYSQRTMESSTNNAVIPTDSIPQVLCRKLIRTVVKYAEAYDLDRAACVQELLEPLSRLTSKKDVQQTAALLLPTYLGLGASILTGNPLPIYLGWAIGGALTAQDMDTLQNTSNNLRDLTATTNRAADVEKTSLLDEVDDE
jgi:hypothetical protein